MLKIKTQFLKNQGKYTAFVTFEGMDYYELGDSEEEAISNLKSKHPQLAHLPC